MERRNLAQTLSHMWIPTRERPQATEAVHFYFVSYFMSIVE